MEKSRSMADVHHLRLMSLLQELVRDKGGIKGEARVLGVDHRTVTASLTGGDLSRRVREALERLLLGSGQRWTLWHGGSTGWRRRPARRIRGGGQAAVGAGGGGDRRLGHGESACCG